MTKDNKSVEKNKITRNEATKNNHKDDLDDCYEGLTMTVTEWLKLYSKLNTPKCRSKLRNVSIAMAHKCSLCKVDISDRGTFTSKYALAAPYYFFLTSVSEAKLTHHQPFTITFHEVIDYTFGEIVNSLHLNYDVDLHWLIIQYMIAAQNPKMTLICESVTDDFNLRESNPFDFNVSLVLKSEFKNHHCKLSILKYKNGTIRILTYTFEFGFNDWQANTHGLWMSPPLPPLPKTADSSEGESITNFKNDIIEYLETYKTLKMSDFFSFNLDYLFNSNLDQKSTETNISEWIRLVQRADCSTVNVCFIASVPGHHKDINYNKWGSRKLGTILSQHAALPSDERNWPVVAQSSTVGTFGRDYHSWLLPQIVEPMSREKDKRIIFLPEFKFIFTSQKNYDESYEKKTDYIATVYEKKNYLLHKSWLKDYLYKWKSEKINRSLSMPRCRTYTRISPDESQIAWFVLTSANLSKGSWGKTIIEDCSKVAWGKTIYEECHYICNHETGVVFIPQIIIGRTTFPVKESKSSEVPVFLLPYDVPLTPYEPDDEPYVASIEASIKYYSRYRKRGEKYYLLDIENVHV